MHGQCAEGRDLGLAALRGEVYFGRNLDQHGSMILSWNELQVWLLSEVFVEARDRPFHMMRKEHIRVTGVGAKGLVLSEVRKYIMGFLTSSKREDVMTVV